MQLKQMLSKLTSLKRLVPCRRLLSVLQSDVPQRSAALQHELRVLSEYVDLQEAEELQKREEEQLQILMENKAATDGWPADLMAQGAHRMSNVFVLVQGGNGLKKGALGCAHHHNWIVNHWEQGVGRWVQCEVRVDRHFAHLRGYDGHWVCIFDRGGVLVLRQGKWEAVWTWDKDGRAAIRRDTGVPCEEKFPMIIAPFDRILVRVEGTAALGYSDGKRNIEEEVEDGIEAVDFD